MVQLLDLGHFPLHRLLELELRALEGQVQRPEGVHLAIVRIDIWVGLFMIFEHKFTLKSAFGIAFPRVEFCRRHVMLATFESNHTYYL